MQSSWSTLLLSQLLLLMILCLASSWPNVLEVRSLVLSGLLYLRRQCLLTCTILILRLKMRKRSLYQGQAPITCRHNSLIQKIIQKSIRRFLTLEEKYMWITIWIDSANKSCQEDQEIQFQALENTKFSLTQKSQWLQRVVISHNNLSRTSQIKVIQVLPFIIAPWNLRRSLSYLTRQKNGRHDIFAT